MASLDDARRIALGLPAVEESTTFGNVSYKVKGKLFAWERPLRARDRADLGDAAPEGDIFAVRVEHEIAKRALLASEPAAFTTPHFDGHASVLLEIAKVSATDLEELIAEAWLCRAPARLAKEFMADA